MSFGEKIKCRDVHKLDFMLECKVKGQRYGLGSEHSYSESNRAGGSCFSTARGSFIPSVHEQSALGRLKQRGL